MLKCIGNGKGGRGTGKEERKEGREFWLCRVGVTDFVAFHEVESVWQGPGEKWSVDTERRKIWVKERKGI